MPAAVEDLQDTYLLSNKHPALEGTKGEDIPYQFSIDHAFYFLKVIIHNKQLAKGHRRGSFFSWSRVESVDPGPPGTLEFWYFALRHYLNLGFKSGTFWRPRRETTYMQSIWWREVGRGDIS
jgi:hypothetical protein